MGDGRSGLGAAIDQARADLKEEADQNAPGLFDELEMGLSPFAVSSKGGASGVAKNARGRPEGSRNRRTQEMVDFLLKRHRDPLIAGFEVSSMGPVQVAQDVFTPKGAEVTAETLRYAAEWWRKVWVETLRYIHSAQPLAVKIEERQYLDINIGDFGLTPAEIVADAVAAIGEASGITADQRKSLIATVLSRDDHSDTIDIPLEESGMFSVSYVDDDEPVSQEPVSQPNENPIETESYAADDD